MITTITAGTAVYYDTLSLSLSYTTLSKNSWVAGDLVLFFVDFLTINGTAVSSVSAPGLTFSRIITPATIALPSPPPNGQVVMELWGAVATATATNQPISFTITALTQTAGEPYTLMIPLHGVLTGNGINGVYATYATAGDLNGGTIISAPLPTPGGSATNPIQVLQFCDSAILTPPSPFGYTQLYGTNPLNALLLTSQYPTNNPITGVVLGTESNGFYANRLALSLYCNVSPVVTFSASWNATCLVRNTIVLTWSIANGGTAIMDHGIGPIAQSGMMTVQFDGNPVYTITATNLAGTTVQPVTAVQMFTSNMITMPKANPAKVFFNSGASFAPGVYLITCCGGAYAWDGVHYGINSNNRRIVSSQAFKVFGTQGTQIDAPGSYPGFASVAASDALNQGQTQLFNHAGGSIGVFLSIDSYVQAVESSEVPAFAITGPAPAVSLTANTIPVITGTAVALIWVVVGSTDFNGITIDQGIGVVASSGSQSVSVTTTTRYTLTATYHGLVVTTYADVLIGLPSLPVMTVTGEVGGVIHISWLPPTCTTQTMVYRSMPGSPGRFTLIATVAAGTLFYDDNPTLPGVIRFYQLQNTDGTNLSDICVSMPGVSLAPPLAAALTAQNVNLIPVLAWITATNAVSYQISRSLTSGAEVVIFTVTVGVAGQQMTAADPTALSGLTYYYTVQGVNQYGVGAASNEVTVTAGFQANYSGGLL